MRIITTFIILCFFISNSFATDTTIRFRQISYSEVFELAKKEQKQVLLYFHFDGCGACLKMEKTSFVDSDVAKFYNENFICFEINTLKGEGIETNKIYEVRLHPTFLFLDENGNTLNKIVGVFSPDEFVLQGNNALKPLKTLAYFKQQYNKGTRNAEFLFEYCYRLRDANELDSLVVNEYLTTQKANQLNTEENIKFIYEFAFHNGEIFISAESNAYKFMHDNKDLFKPYFDIEQVETRLMLITLTNVYQAIENRDSVGFWKAIEVLKEYDTGKEYNFKEMDGRITFWTDSKSLVLTAELAYYQKVDNLTMYNKTLNTFIKSIWNDSEALNTFAWGCYEVENDSTILKKALECVIQSIELNSNYNNNDTYIALLYKVNEYDAALIQAETTILIAKKEDRDYQETTKLIVKIKEKISNKNFDWLLGNWKRNNDVDGKETFEVWTKISNSEYYGIGFTMQKNDTLSQEKIRLVKSGEKWNLEVRLQDELIPTTFNMTSYNDHEFICENKTHDFPKLIKYWKNGNKINALVSGDDMEISFEFDRMEVK